MNENRYYSLVGSRTTPSLYCARLHNIAMYFATGGWIMRSGKAKGADSAGEAGCTEVRGKKEIYLPEIIFVGTCKNSDHIYVNELPASARAIADNTHGAFHRLDTFGIHAHTRNVGIILGKDLKTPSEFVVCWTPNGEAVGGTRTAILLAKQRNIPVFNLGAKDNLKKSSSEMIKFIEKFINSRPSDHYDPPQFSA